MMVKNNLELIKKKLVDFAPLQRGFDLPNQSISEGEYPIVYSNGIKNYHSSYKSKAPGVVMGRSGTIGKVTYVDHDYWPHNTSLWVTDFKGNYPKYVFYALQNINYKKYNSGSGVPTLNRNDIHHEIVFVPPLPEQEAIANILEKWDEATSKTAKLIEAKKKSFEWLLNNLLKKQQGYKYKTIRIKDCCNTITTGKLDANAMIKNGKYRFYTCAKEYFFINEYKFDGEALLISGNGANVGYIHYYKGKFNAYQRTYVLMNFKENIHYIKYCLDKNLRQRINSQVNGGNTPYIRLETISDMKVEIPNSEILSENIVKTLNTAKKEITILEEILAKYKSQKKGLMQKLLTGKIRVNNINSIN